VAWTTLASVLVCDFCSGSFRTKLMGVCGWHASLICSIISLGGIGTWTLVVKVVQWLTVALCSVLCYIIVEDVLVVAISSRCLPVRWTIHLQLALIVPVIELLLVSRIVGGCCFLCRRCVVWSSRRRSWWVLVWSLWWCWVPLEILLLLNLVRVYGNYTSENKINIET